MARSVHGDLGAGRYLAEHGAELIDCGDLATGVDVDYAVPGFTLEAPDDLELGPRER